MAGRRGDGRKVVGLNCGEGGSSRGWDGVDSERVRKRSDWTAWFKHASLQYTARPHRVVPSLQTCTMICVSMIISLEECASLSNLHEGSCGLLWSGRTLDCVLRHCVTTEGLDTGEDLKRRVFDKIPSGTTMERLQEGETACQPSRGLGA